MQRESSKLILVFADIFTFHSNESKFNIFATATTSVEASAALNKKYKSELYL